jgi:hypothetical protein
MLEISLAAEALAGLARLRQLHCAGQNGSGHAGEPSIIESGRAMPRGALQVASARLAYFPIVPQRSEPGDNGRQLA